MAGVKLTNINKKYDNGFHAVKDVNLDIADKEFMILVGPSGCGKTTTLRMIAGLESISEGDLLIGDARVNDISPKDRDIAMVFQNYALYPHMTVYENMAFGLKLRKRPKSEIDDRVKKAAAILGIEEMLTRKPKELSGGQRQRVALGRAIVRHPQVFLMDEPLSNLDAKLRVQMRAELIKLHYELGTTFIYVTHDQTEAMTMGTRICVMNKGVIQQIATPNEIYNHPANLFVAGFIGSPAMNTLDATLAEQEGRLTVHVNGAAVGCQKPDFGRERWTEHLGKPLVLGVRPEDISLCSAQDEGALAGQVDVTEFMGAELFINIKAGEATLVAKVRPEQQVKMGDSIWFRFDPTRLHLFDKETEKAL
jgi:multiple sugar transport system ATP-binding protein